MSSFSAIVDEGVPFTEIVDSDESDFADSGDMGLLRIPGTLFGAGGFGEGLFGGPATYILSPIITEWVDVDEP